MVVVQYNVSLCFTCFLVLPQTGTPGNPSTPTPPASTNDCDPCNQNGYRTYTSPSGSTCYCLGGSTEPWEWSDKKCVNDYVGLPNEEERPYFCLGSGSNPNSRACLSQCNFMLNTVNSLNPCNQNLYNAARTCADCVPGGAIHYQLDGRSPSGPYIQGIESMNIFMDGMKNWCARPSRCIDLSTGGKISGTGGCPVINNTPNNSPASNSPIRGGGGGSTPGSPGSVRPAGGNTASAKIVTSSTISTTDANGRPTFSIQLATIDNPDFTANTGFATARPNTGSNGAARMDSKVSKAAVAFAMIAALIVAMRAH
ncbi:hypothetical protein P389DRAFT_168168 [Cystobasidium minutum MCA 4210]|uniref:uncharacterized protein n=1 Tax=Cystobasidium minutum MCA 4210 TaxID=1397322 RepID=UPI0034CEBC21|eukprot:jgi/Rhomi1/168168/fgenesh1_kg.2_\